LSETAKLRCPACGGDMAFEPPASTEPPSGLAQYQPASASLRAPNAPGSLAPEQEDFLRGYSWGPGCGFYYFSRAMIMFWFVQFAVSFMLGFGAALLSPEPRQPSPDSYVYSEYKDESGSLSFVDVVAQIFGWAIAVWAGTEARRRRWNTLTWNSFEEFLEDESKWNRYGLYGWIIAGVVFLAGLIFSIYFAVTS
jgi:hypothetical protein